MKTKIYCNIWSAKNVVPSFEQLVAEDQKRIELKTSLADLAAEMAGNKKSVASVPHPCWWHNEKTA